MKARILLLFFGLLLCVTAWSQTPQAINYQAIARDGNGSPLPLNQQIGVRFTLHQGSANGPVTYEERHQTNVNSGGVYNLKIGTGTVQQGTFTSINWGSGQYYMEVGLDASGGTNFTAVGTAQMVSVPYALHAQTADQIVGPLSEIDPVFASSVASGISNIDTAYWNGKLDNFVETDPTFNASVAHGITSLDTAKWNDKLSSYTETDPIFTTSIVSGITGWDTANWNNKLSSFTEGDPLFSTSVAHGINGVDTSRWNQKQNALTAGPGITIANGVISASNATTTYTIGLNSTLGGFVYYVTPDGKHGLVAANIDQGAYVSWDNALNRVHDPANYDIIGRNFTDWHLPSISEYMMMAPYRYSIGLALTTHYWTSILYHTHSGSYNQAYTFLVYPNGQAGATVFPCNQTGNFFVRAVRSF